MLEVATGAVDEDRLADDEPGPAVGLGGALLGLLHLGVEDHPRLVPPVLLLLRGVWRAGSLRALLRRHVRVGVVAVEGGTLGDGTVRGERVHGAVAVLVHVARGDDRPLLGDHHVTARDLGHSRGTARGDQKQNAHGAPPLG